MATFEGTIQEFHAYLGPRIRNKINNLTRGHRLQRRGKCDDCGEVKELHSAHLHGHDRRIIIEDILSQYEYNGKINLDINEVEVKILQAHLPLEKNFKFLCHSCHVRYDQHQESEEIEELDSVISKDTDFVIGQNNNNESYKYLYRIRMWAKKPTQYNHKIIKAYLSLEKNGTVYLDNLKRLCSDKNSPYFVDTFNTNYPQMKTDLGHPHGKVFYDDRGIVSIYPRVRMEIKQWFGE
jgi:hypothetical protein